MRPLVFTDDLAVDLTDTAAALSATATPCTAIVVQANIGNAGTASVGDSASQSLQLAAGDSATIWTRDVSGIYAVSDQASGDAVNVHVYQE